jgi:hypothetical protein
MIYFSCLKTKNETEGFMADFFAKREADLLERFKNFSAVFAAKASAWVPGTVAPFYKYGISIVLAENRL